MLVTAARGADGAASALLCALGSLLDDEALGRPPERLGGVSY